MTDLRETGEVADAVAGNWVDRLAPPAMRPWLRLSRADRPAGTWLLLIPCLWAVTLAAAQSGWRPFDLWLIAGCGIGAFLMRGAGCTWNDITDRDFDGAVARTRSRPIPSGQVTVRGALVWLVAQALVAFGILLTFPAAAIWLGVLSLLPVAVYPFAKRFTWWPQVFLGVAFNWGALLAWAAHAGNLPMAALPLYAGGIAWTLFYDTIYAYQDIEDDALIGVRSTARRFGDRPGPWLAGFAAGAACLMALSVGLATGGAGRWVALVGVAGFVAHLAWQFRRLDHRDPATCLELFRSNRDAGLIPLPFFAAAAFV
ncbi:4-hydroxybenzoate octaprenyltransferase [Jannaschia aquimarina]|uniref:4-hydroxybenzoate octaprenyltransferase n=1 Tax=Jannaschia aquimarina TaxID=935700 RepID=A0A0D1EN14_9RHOB|nr:4-hydroxybenzoate octaprenyltransferase [Jannaschia aquimarina]KIT17095.1 4-hydroxybenzoate octaprenyltransferase [Jannaschia aquimarina]SNS46687.1 4-hydroxybenzoate polyprenyltransferase [Jannaschia aquimarina]